MGIHLVDRDPRKAAKCRQELLDQIRRLFDEISAIDSHLADCEIDEHQKLQLADLRRTLADAEAAGNESAAVEIREAIAEMETPVPTADTPDARTAEDEQLIREIADSLSDVVPKEAAFPSPLERMEHIAVTAGADALELKRENDSLREEIKSLRETAAKEDPAT